MRRVSVDIGGTFTDCFVAWDGRHVQSKALSTHHNLTLGFNAAIENACEELGVTVTELLGALDSVRYATTLGTNALIERKGPRVGLLVTAGFLSTVPIGRARGYGEGLDPRAQADVPNAQRPVPLVPIQLIRQVRERVDYRGEVLMELDEADVRVQLLDLIDEGAETIVVMLTNSVVNPAHELRIQEIFAEEYPAHLLGAVPMVLTHRVVGRKGEYGRAMSAVIDGFLHSTMYHGLGNLELNLRDSGYRRPMLVVHNSGGMAQMNSTDALQTLHSGPISGIAAAEELARQNGLGSVVATDMGGTSFDIGIVVEGGIKHYDFAPVIDRFLVSVPMVHLVTLGAGGGSIASYDRLYRTVRIGPESAGSTPGPAAYDRGGLNFTVTDADLLLGYLDPDDYAGGHIRLSPSRAEFAAEEGLCEDLDLKPVEVAKLVKSTVDANMANGIATELRAHGYDPRRFTILAYGGNGPLHACGIANALGVDAILAPPFSSVFSACGASSISQMHIHEASTYTILFHAVTRQFLSEFDEFNATIERLEAKGRADLLRQGVPEECIRHRLELDMRYADQRLETTVVSDIQRLSSVGDVVRLADLFFERFGERYGTGSQTPEAGVRVNTIRVCTFVEQPPVSFGDIRPPVGAVVQAEPIGSRSCHFVGHSTPLKTDLYRAVDLEPGSRIRGPALITSPVTTYLIEPGWQVEIGRNQAVWFSRIQPNQPTSGES
jgi:N-methylhydantoinase A